MDTVRGLLQTKGHDVWSVSPGATVFEALEIMADKDVGALLVLKNEQIVGIMSERDYARKVILQGRSSRDTPVRDIMTSRVMYVQPGQSVKECMALMTEKRVRHLPVLEEGRLIGVISIGDVVKAIISEQEYLIQHLETYISGG